MDPWEGEDAPEKEPGGLVWGAQEPRVGDRRGRSPSSRTGSRSHPTLSVLCGGAGNCLHFRKVRKQRTKQHSGFKCIKRSARLARVKINTEGDVLFPGQEVPFIMAGMLVLYQRWLK